MRDAVPDVRLLGQIILLQSTLHVMRDDQALARFLCRGLSRVPGFESQTLFLNDHLYAENDITSVAEDDCRALYFQLRRYTNDMQRQTEVLAGFRQRHGVECLKIQTIFEVYGFLLIPNTVDQTFNALLPYVENTLNMVALIIENNRHRELLELKVQQRTAALQESEQKYRSLFELESDALFLIENESGRILEVNAAAPALYGYTKDELLRMRNTDLSAEPSRTRQATEEKQTRIPVRYHRKKDGSAFPVEITGSHIAWQDKPAHIAAIRDISFRLENEKERARLESQLRQSQKMEAIGTLAGGIAHDFNNILAIILGNVELAIDGLSPHAPLYEHLEESKIAALRARDLIRQILDFSRKSQPLKKPLAIGPFLSEALKLLRASLPATIVIQSRIGSFSAVIHANPTQINQILLNLCTNAAQSMNYEGQMSISLGRIGIEAGEHSAIKGLNPGEYIQLSVSDTGGGVKPEYLEKIFDPYFTTKAVGQGSGLGLAVVYGIVKAHAGEVTVYSEEGRGTTFNIYLPIVQDAVETKSDVAQPLPRGHERIMLVDDEPMLLNLIAKIAVSLGYSVMAHENPHAALNYFKAHPDQVDLVITDMTMPELPGHKLALELLKIRPAIPVIICTGHSELMDREAALKIGVRKYLMKPLTRQTLAHAIRDVLDH